MTLVVDSSAAVAIMLGEPERDRFILALAPGPNLISAGNVIEIVRVMGKHKNRRTSPVWTFLDLFAVEVVPVDLEQVRLAEEGMRRFGIGRGQPPAVLNFGDLFAYALAKARSAPLLFKGDDFGLTDVTPAAIR